MRTENLEDICELSPAQQGILFHALYDRTSGAYIEQIIYSIRGALNVPASREPGRWLLIDTRL